MAGGLHSRVVAAARVGLPVVALALLSTLFFLARTVDPTDAVPFADVALSERARDQQVTAPRVVGRSAGGTAFEVIADAARPGAADPRRMRLTTLRVELDGAGSDTVIDAVAGTVDGAARTLVLEGDVVIADARGFTLRTDRLEGALGALRLASPGPARGETPFGTVEAGAALLEEVDGARRLSFTDGVTLLYHPPDP